MASELPTKSRDELWTLLVDTVHALPMYKSHKRFVEEGMIKEAPEITSKELAVQLNVTIGEATVMLYELRAGKHHTETTPPATNPPPKTNDRSLFDFTK